MTDTADGRSRGPGRSGAWYAKLLRPRFIIALVAAILALIFILENNQQVRIHFIFFTVHSRLWVGFLVSLVLGALLGQAFISFRRRRQARHPPSPAPSAERPAA